MPTPISVHNLDSAGGVIVGTPMQTFWSVEGQLVTCVGDKVESHGPSPHQGPSMVTGSAWMTLNGIPVCRVPDVASCGHSTSGRSWWMID